MGMIIAIDDDDGADGATAQAGNGLERELLVLGGLAGLDLQPPFEFIEDPGPTPDMTGRALADSADVLSPRGQAEGAVKSGHGHHIGERDVQRFGDEPQAVFGEIPVFTLDVLENGDQALFIPEVPIDERLDFFCFRDHFYFSGWWDG
jgi:hypothetical protein